MFPGPVQGTVRGSRIRIWDSCVLCLVSPSCLSQLSHHIPQVKVNMPFLERKWYRNALHCNCFMAYRKNELIMSCLYSWSEWEVCIGAVWAQYWSYLQSTCVQFIFKADLLFQMHWQIFFLRLRFLAQFSRFIKKKCNRSFTLSTGAVYQCCGAASFSLSPSHIKIT
jgi:glycosyltransferase involved in cell wall biosynthesis